MFKTEICTATSNLKILNKLKGVNHRFKMRKKTYSRWNTMYLKLTLYVRSRCFTMCYFICLHNNAL